MRLISEDSLYTGKLGFFACLQDILLLCGSGGGFFLFRKIYKVISW